MKAGAVATFTYLSVLITFLGYKFYCLIVYKKNLIGKNKSEIKQWLYESDEHMDQAKATEITREECLGIVLIFSGVFLLLISFKDEQPIEVNNEKSEKCTTEKTQGTCQREEVTLCKSCRLASAKEHKHE